MSEIRFKSLFNGDKYGYIMDTSRFYYRRTNAHCGFGSMYETYGHGNVQHSGEFPLTWEFYNDFCLSLAKHILDNVGDESIHSLALSYAYRPIAYKELLAINKIYEHAKAIKDATEEEARKLKTKWYHTREFAVSTSWSKSKHRDWEEIKDHLGTSPLATAFCIHGGLACLGDCFILLRNAERLDDQLEAIGLDKWAQKKE